MSIIIAPSMATSSKRKFVDEDLLNTKRPCADVLKLSLGFLSVKDLNSTMYASTDIAKLAAKVIMPKVQVVWKLKCGRRRKQGLMRLSIDKLRGIKNPGLKRLSIGRKSLGSGDCVNDDCPNRHQIEITTELLGSIPSTVTHLSIKGHCEGPLLLPKGLTHLRISCSLTDELELEDFHQLRTLILDNEITVKSLPLSLKNLEMQDNEHMPSLKNLSQLIHLKMANCEDYVGQILPYGLISLEIDYCENGLGKLPSTLQKLIVLDNFDSSLDDLPLSLTGLRIGKTFNKPLDLLPANLRVLEFVNDSDFDLPLDHLPPSLEMLLLGDSFDHPIDNLPAGLTRLKIGEEFDQQIDALPASLKILNFHKNSVFNHPVDNLPTNLIELSFGQAFNFRLNVLPQNLNRLFVGPSFNHPLDHLPDNLISLHVGIEFNYPLDHLPQRLAILLFPPGSFFNHNMHFLPRSLQCLFCSPDFSQLKHLHSLHQLQVLN